MWLDVCGCVANCVGVGCDVWLASCVGVRVTVLLCSIDKYRQLPHSGAGGEDSKELDKAVSPESSAACVVS